jgi:hypothetical protein
VGATGIDNVLNSFAYYINSLSLIASLQEELKELPYREMKMVTFIELSATSFQIYQEKFVIFVDSELINFIKRDRSLDQCISQLYGFYHYRINKEENALLCLL